MKLKPIFKTTIYHGCLRKAHFRISNSPRSFPKTFKTTLWPIRMWLLMVPQVQQCFLIKLLLKRTDGDMFIHKATNEHLQGLLTLNVDETIAAVFTLWWHHSKSSQTKYQNSRIKTLRTTLSIAGININKNQIRYVLEPNVYTLKNLTNTKNHIF